MTRRDPDELIETVEGEKETISEHYLPAVEWFLERPGLAPRTEVVEDLADHLDVEGDVAGAIVGHLVSDDVDPVQQVLRPTEGKYVGVISHAEHEWFYSFDRYDDVTGRETRAVCAHCVHEEAHAADAAHFTRSPEEYDADRARVALGLHYQVDHEGRSLPAVLAEDLDVDPEAFADRHGLAGVGALSLRDVTRRLDTDPGLQEAVTGANATLSVPEVDVEPGASLATGTTIAGKVSWHAGNDGAGSTLDADTVDDKHADELCCLLQRDPSGDAYIVNSWTSSTQTGTLLQSDTKQLTVTPSTSIDVAFLTGNAPNGFSLRTIKQDGSTVSPNTPGVLVTDVTTNAAFTFTFHATTQTNNTVTASVKEGTYV